MIINYGIRIKNPEYEKARLSRRKPRLGMDTGFQRLRLRRNSMAVAPIIPRREVDGSGITTMLPL